MSKKKKIIIACLGITILLLSIIFGYTYSKYVHTETVKGSASVAKWSFNGAISNTRDDDLESKEISLADSMNSNDSVKSKTIAPGTSGSFKIIIDAEGSEVGVDYDVFLADETDEENGENRKPANLYFTCDDLLTGQGEKFYSLEEMLKNNSDDSKSNLSGTIAKDAESKRKVITVNWNWPYESNENGLEKGDIQDTKDSNITNYRFTLNIVGKQAK